MKKLFLTLAFVGVASSMFAYYRSPGEEFGAGIMTLVIIVLGVLNLIFFFKIWGMTNDVKELKNEICPDNLRVFPFLLKRKVMEFKYLGKTDEAKKMLDEIVRSEFFPKILVSGKSVSVAQNEVERIINKYEKYYKILDVEMPNEIKEIDVEKIMGEYSSL